MRWLPEVGLLWLLSRTGHMAESQDSIRTFVQGMTIARPGCVFSVDRGDLRAGRDLTLGTIRRAGFRRKNAPDHPEMFFIWKCHIPP